MKVRYQKKLPIAEEEIINSVSVVIFGISKEIIEAITKFCTCTTKQYLKKI
jgi:hypothetical protein